MKMFRLFAVTLFLTAVFSISAFAQAAQPAAQKIGLIDIGAFGADKGGITKYVNAVTALDKEFTTVRTDLQGAVTRIQTLEKEINTMREQASKPNSPISATTVNNKLEELDNLKRKAKFDQDNANAKYQSRYDTLVAPIFLDIRKAIQEYAKSKGFSLILDGGKLEESGILWGFDEKINITTDFIQYYNTRPAGAAAAK